MNKNEKEILEAQIKVLEETRRGEFMQKTDEIMEFELAAIKQIKIVTEEDEDLGEVPSEDSCDAFGFISLRKRSEPEDAIWRRDIGSDFYEAVKMGARNLVAALIENREMFERLEKLKKKLTDKGERK